MHYFTTYALLFYYLCITIYVLLIVYITLPPGIGPIAVGNKYYIYIYIYIIFVHMRMCVHTHIHIVTPPRHSPTPQIEDRTQFFLPEKKSQSSVFGRFGSIRFLVVPKS
jgi:hypothetical protein